MFKNVDPSRITAIFCMALLACALVGVAGAPSSSYADGSPGGVEPPPSEEPPPDTTHNPDEGMGGYDSPGQGIPLGLEVMLTLLKLTI